MLRQHPHHPAIFFTPGPLRRVNGDDTAGNIPDVSESLQEEKLIAATQEEVNLIKKSQLEMLEKLSGLSQEEAKNYLLQNIESEVRHESAMKIKEIEAQYKEDADKLARAIPKSWRTRSIAGSSCRSCRRPPACLLRRRSSTSPLPGLPSGCR